MPRYQRYDTDGPSEAELQQRWRRFHRSVRATTSGPMVRLLAPLLGDDTVRRRAVHALLSRRSSAGTASSPAVGDIAIRNVDRLRPPATVPSADALARTALVAVDLDDLEGTFRRLDDVLSSPAEWLLLHDGTNEHASAALAALWPFTSDVGVVFADEEGVPIPILKSPAVGQHTLLSTNVVGRPALVRIASLRSCGGVRRQAGVAFEWDLSLRLYECGARFRHVSAVLPALGGATVGEHPDFAVASCEVVTEALRRRGLEANVSPGPLTGSVHWRVTPPTWPLVDIIIPTRDRVDLVRQCVESIVARSTYPAYRITILDNDSAEDETLRYFAEGPFEVVPCPGPFNYAAIMNRGVAATAAPLVLTLNNDTIVDTPDWLEQLVEVALLEGVGLVGCRTTDGHGIHDHDGVVIAPYPQHLRGGVNWPLGTLYTEVTRDITAVTGAVTLIRREAWESVAGMDETLAVVMNDIDLCLRLQNADWSVVVVPSVLLTHHVSSSRGRLDPLADRNRFVRRWDIFGSFVDPYFPEALRLYGSTMVAEPSLDFGASKENP